MQKPQFFGLLADMLPGAAIKGQKPGEPRNKMVERKEKMDGRCKDFWAAVSKLCWLDYSSFQASSCRLFSCLLKNRRFLVLFGRLSLLLLALAAHRSAGSIDFPDVCPSSQANGASYCPGRTLARLTHSARARWTSWKQKVSHSKCISTCTVSIEPHSWRRVTKHKNSSVANVTKSLLAVKKVLLQGGKDNYSI